MKLTYEAIDGSGQVVNDIMEAATVATGVEELRKQGLFVTQVDAGSEESDPAEARRAEDDELGNLKLSVGKMTLFTRQMAMLLKSGSAVVPALLSIAQQVTDPRERRMVHLIKDDLEEGNTLTDALRKFPRTFPPSFCAIIAAGESSATLPQMFGRLATIIAKRQAIRNRIIGAMTYPILLSMLSLSVLGVMMFVVVPRFAGLFTTLGVSLPTTTEMMITAASSFRDSWLPIFAVLVVMTLGLIWILHTERAKQVVSNMQIRIPVLGRLISRLIQAQVFRVLGMLLEAKVGLLEAMQLARGITRNGAYQDLLDKLDDSVTRGDSISGAMEGGSLVSPAFIQAIRTGEQSGRLGESITFVADILDEENSELLMATTKLIEPLVLILMGCAVGTVAVSLFLPLFDMTAAI